MLWSVVRTFAGIVVAGPRRHGEPVVLSMGIISELVRPYADELGLVISRPSPDRDAAAVMPTDQRDVEARIPTCVTLAALGASRWADAVNRHRAAQHAGPGRPDRMMVFAVSDHGFISKTCRRVRPPHLSALLIWATVAGGVQWPLAAVISLSLVVPCCR